ncbi:hypothetical protein BDR06DRAFT_978076 [Suillus hirtellus]|nr:hypothetical protein BDR06DRAFT_978076 [Suillus hirtellus]
MSLLDSPSNTFDPPSRVSTPECLWGCTWLSDCDHGPGPHVYTCNCHRYLNALEKFKEPPMGQDGGPEDDNHDTPSPRDFGHDTNKRRATSVPIIELPLEKRRKTGRNYVLCEEELMAKVLQEVAAVCKSMSKIGAIFERQHSVLLELCIAFERHGI